MKPIDRVRFAVKAGALVLALVSAGAAAAWPAESRHGHGAWEAAGPFVWPGWPLAPPPPREPAPLPVPPPPHGLYGREYHPRYGRWAPGQFLPAGAPATVIADPAALHLRRAPPGYIWVMCDGDFMLISASSSLIFEVIPGAGD